jgi:type IV pilus assembly protein PilM
VVSRFGLAAKRRLAIDWDAQSLRVVQFRPQGASIEVIKAVSVPIPPQVRLEDPESLGAFLREVLGQARIHDRRALLDIPRDQVVLNTLTLPPTPLDDLPALVYFQAVKELPFAAEQATLDFVVQGMFDPKSPSRVLVAAVRSDALTFYRRLAREAGLRLERIGLRPHANMVAFTAGLGAKPPERLLGVDVGPVLTEINIIRDGGLVFSRAATVRLFDVEGDTDAEDEPSASVTDSRLMIAASPQADAEEPTTREAVNAVLVEVIRSIEAYRATDPSARITQAIVAGSTGIEAALAEGLQRRLNTSVELYDPGRALDLTPPRAKELRGFSAALGLAMGHEATGPSHFNFLQPKRAVTRQARRLRRLPATVGVALVLITAVVAIRWNVLRPKHQRIDALRTAVAALSRDVQGFSKTRNQHTSGVRDLRERIEAVDQWMSGEGHWLLELWSLVKAFPLDKEAYATKLVFVDQPPSVDMDLRTKHTGVITVLMDRLREAGFEATGGKSAESAGADEFMFTETIRISLRDRSARTADAKPPSGEGRP